MDIRIIYFAGSYDRQARKIVDMGVQKAMNKGYINQIYKEDKIFKFLDHENKDKIDIFHCHSGYSLEAMKFIKQKTMAKIILQRDSSHVIQFIENLEKEEEKWRSTEYKHLCSNSSRQRTNIKAQLEEYMLADYILLASTLEYDSFVSQGVPKDKLKIIPFTADSKVFYPRNYSHDFSVLLGGNQHLRKGFPYAKEVCKNVGIPLNIMEGIPFEQVPNELNQHSIILAPAADDGYPHQVLASMLCGLIPIISTLNGVKDLIRHGINGFIFNLDDNAVITKITNIVRKLKDDNKLCKKIGEQARATIMKRTWENYGEDICKFYEEIYLSKKTEETRI